jgi:hypothetical protein
MTQRNERRAATTPNERANGLIDTGPGKRQVRTRTGGAGCPAARRFGSALRGDDHRRRGVPVSQLAAQRSEFAGKGAECVVTRDGVPGIQSPAVVVADRWGEVVHVAATSQVGELTSPAELLQWVDYLGRRCPECEGEAR